MNERREPPLVYIDANVFIEFFEGLPHRVARLEEFFDRLRSHPGTAATSELTLAETLGKGARGTTWDAQKEFYVGLLCENMFIDLRSITRELLVGTGDLRRSAAALGRAVKLSDAIHITTAISAGCLYFLSADRRIFCPSFIRRVIPDDDGLAKIEASLDA